MKQYQLIVIGSGKLGLAIANQAVKWGAQVALLHQSEEEGQPLIGSEGVDVYSGSVRFVTEGELEVDGGMRIGGRSIIIALEPIRRIPEIDGLAELGKKLDDEGAKRRPLAKKWMVLGGTTQGVEWAQALARQGAQVTIVEAGKKVLPDYDPDCRAVLEKVLWQEGIRLRCQTDVVKVIQRANKNIVQLRFDGLVEAVETDELLLAEVDLPNMAALGLDSLGLELKQGRVIADRAMRVSRQIYAVGEGVAQRPLGRFWPEEVERVTLNALLGLTLAIDYSSMPRVTKTNPALVAIGMSEEQARNEGKRYRVWHRVLTPDGEWVEEFPSDTGRVKLITDEDGTILGIHAVGQELSTRLAALLAAKRHHKKITHPRRFQELLQWDSTDSHRVWNHSLRFRLEDWIEKGIRVCVRLRK